MLGEGVVDVVTDFVVFDGCHFLGRPPWQTHYFPNIVEQAVPLDDAAGFGGRLNVLVVSATDCVSGGLMGALPRPKLTRGRIAGAGLLDHVGELVLQQAGVVTGLGRKLFAPPHHMATDGKGVRGDVVAGLPGGISPMNSDLGERSPEYRFKTGANIRGQRLSGRLGERVD
jgi:hypothetical protein